VREISVLKEASPSSHADPGRLFDFDQDIAGHKSYKGYSIAAVVL